MNNTSTETTTGSTDRQGSVHRRSKLYGGIAALVVIAAAVAAGQSFARAPVSAAAPSAPVVNVSRPLERELHGRIQFLGQFSPVDQVELRAQVGGTLTYIGFTDGDVVRKNALLFIVDPTPYQIKFDEGTAQVAKARARLGLATAELTRAQTLQRTDAGTVENVDQRGRSRGPPKPRLTKQRRLSATPGSTLTIHISTHPSRDAWERISYRWEI